MGRIFVNRLGFRARLLALKNKKVIEEHSTLKLGAGRRCREAPGLDWCNL